MEINGCPLCLVKQRLIDELEEEVQSLRRKLRSQQRKAEEGLFGSSTPSSKRPLKPNVEEKENKPKGARPGHRGAGRRRHGEESVDRVVEVAPESELCPESGCPLEKKGWEERSVVDTPSAKPERIDYRLGSGIAPVAGKRLAREPHRMVLKHPLSGALLQMQGTLADPGVVDGPVAPAKEPGTNDPVVNARHITRIHGLLLV